MSSKVPKAIQVAELLTTLLGKDVQAKAAPELHAFGGTTTLVADFVDPGGKLWVLFAADLEFAARSGAALALVPASTAETAIDAGELDEALRDNFREVANVMTAIYGLVDVRLILTKMCLAKDTSPETRALIAEASERFDVNVQIADYGAGKISFIAR